MNIAWIRFDYFNEHHHMRIGVIGGQEYVSKLIPKFQHVIPLGGGESIHWGDNEHGIVNFGLWCDDPAKRPGHGGMWSSRGSVVGPLIGKRLVPVGINGISTHMTYEKVEEILPEEYEIQTQIVGNETYFEIQRKDGLSVPTQNPTVLGCGYWLGGGPLES